MKILEVLARFLPARAVAVRARAGGVRKPQRPHGRQLSVPPAQLAQGQLALDRAAPVSLKSFPADPSLPQLEVAKDPERMREVFQRHLRPLGEKTYEVRECRILGSHHRDGHRCLVQYDLRLAESGTGRERSQSVTGVMYAGDRTRRKWNKLWRSGRGRGLPGASTIFAPFSYVPDLEMLVQVFPYDHRLPALPLLMVGPPPELEPLLLARFGPGDWRAEAWDVELVRYFPIMRATLRLTARAWDAATGRTEERRFYAKVYSSEEEGERSYRVLRELWDKASVGGVSFTVGKPIAYLSGLQTLLQEEVPGTSLYDILLGEEEEATLAMRKAAKALASLHLLDEVAAPQRRLRDDLESAGKLLRSACPHLGPEIEKIVGAVVAGLEEVPPTPIHGDLHPEHILLDGDSLALIDLDWFTEADPVWDVAFLLVNLADVPLRSPHDRSQMVARAFVEEYFARVPEAWRARLPLQYASAILRRAADPLRHQSPGCPDKIEAVVEEAKDSLAGRVW